MIHLTGFIAEAILADGYNRSEVFPLPLQAQLVERLWRAEHRKSREANPKSGANVVGFRVRKVQARFRSVS